MRPYRWQDPPPPPVQAIRWRRDQFDRFRAEPEPSTPEQWLRKHVPEVFEPAPVPSMVIEGVEYVEAPEYGGCAGCEFLREPISKCLEIRDPAAISAFGGNCRDRRVIYIRKA